jgi:hypothetical protein
VNGKRGDHPITDIVVYGDAIFGEPADSMIRELVAADRREEIDSTVLWALIADDDLVPQLEAIQRRRPSVKLEFKWAKPYVDARVPDPWGGWHFTTPVEIIDDSTTRSGVWLMDLEIRPGRDATGNRRAMARFLSEAAPWERLVTGAELRLTFDARNEDGRAVVVDTGH